MRKEFKFIDVRLIPRSDALGGFAWTGILVGLLVFGALSMLVGAEEDAHPGKAIYQRLCVDCHGPQGEGVAGEFDEPLQGTRSLASLTRKIDRTMPEDDEDACIDEEAEAVAEYIYGAFYSAEARARRQLASREFSRLTAEQHRASIADLVGGFRRGGGWPEKEVRGLRGRYYDGGRRVGEQGIGGEANMERQDDRVAFDFGTSSPDEKITMSEEFSITWDGSLLVEESGIYEFVVRSRNGFRLHVNDMRNAAVDGWVSSGSEVREETGQLYLLGGRAYPLRLHFFKHREDGAMVELWWKPPGGNLEIIPQSQLAPEAVRPTLVLVTPFPAEDRSAGYERGISISKAWMDAVTLASIETADYVIEHLEDLVRIRKDDAEREVELRAFCSTFIERAWRRPLSRDERRQLVDAVFEKEARSEQAVRRIVLATLSSPGFLYPELELEGGSRQAVAARLALALWDSVPDEALLAAAEKGQLDSLAGVRAEARRMVEDPRSRHKTRGFFKHWLELKDPDAIAKDPEVFNGFSVEELIDLRRSLLMFVDRVVWQGSGDYRELLLADYLYLNQRLAPIYGKRVDGDGFERVVFPQGERSGVITHPYQLTAFSFFVDTSPIHRGVFLTRHVMGRTLRPPPEDIDFEGATFDESLTMREKVTEFTRPASCMACHSTINPLGFSLENFDAIGRVRDNDRGKPVDTAGDFEDDDGGVVRLESARDVAEFAANSEVARRGFIREIFNHSAKQPIEAYGEGATARLLQVFNESECNIPTLLVEAAVVAATLGEEEFANAGHAAAD